MSHQSPQYKAQEEARIYGVARSDSCSRLFNVVEKGKVQFQSESQECADSYSKFYGGSVVPNNAKTILLCALQEIMDNETKHSNATVKRMAKIARKAISQANHE